MDLLSIINKNSNNSDCLKKEFIDSQLEKVGLDSSFVEALRKSDGEISGFFLLRCMKKKWFNIETDLDIFIYTLNHKTVNKIRSKLKKDSVQLTPVENWLWEKINYDDKKFNYSNYEIINDNSIQIIREYKLPKIKVQIIHVNIGGTVFNFIKQNFDFKFLCNTYNGQELKIWDLHSIQEEKSEYLQKKNFETYSGIYRCIKYSNRGFKIVNWKQPKDLIIEIRKRTYGGYGVDARTFRGSPQYLYKILEMQNKPIKFNIKYSYNKKIYDHNEITISEIDDMLKQNKNKKNNIKTKETPKTKLQHIQYLLNKYFPKEISQLICDYINVGKKIFKSSDLKNSNKMKEFLLNILEYLEINRLPNHKKMELYHIISPPEGVVSRIEGIFIKCNNLYEANILSRLLFYIFYKNNKDDFYKKKFKFMFTFENFIYSDSKGNISIQNFSSCLQDQTNKLLLIDSEKKNSEIYEKIKGIDNRGITLEELEKYIHNHM